MDDKRPWPGKKWERGLQQQPVSCIHHLKDGAGVCVSCREAAIGEKKRGEEKKILPIGCVTRVALDPDRVLEAPLGQLTGVVVVGMGKDGEVWASSSYADGGAVMWLLEACKKRLLEAGA